MKTFFYTQKFFVALLAVTVFAIVANAVHAANVVQKRSGLASELDVYRHYTTLSATTTNATSSELSVTGASKVQVYFKYNDGSGTATSTFRLEVSPNGTDWYAYNKLISNVSNTNAQTITRVATVQAVGTTSATYALDLVSDVFDQVRCVVAFASTTVTAADDATCEVSVEVKAAVQ